MIIKSLRLQNVLSYGTNAVEFSDFSRFNIFIGKNNSGKSNIIRAMRMALDNLSTALADGSFQHPRYWHRTQHATRLAPFVSIRFQLPAEETKLLHNFLHHLPSEARDDVHALLKPGFDLICTPKTNSPQDISVSLEAASQPDIMTRINSMEPSKTHWKDTLKAVTIYAGHYSKENIRYIGGFRSINDPLETQKSINQLLMEWANPDPNNYELQFRHKTIERIFNDLLQEKDVRLHPRPGANDLCVTFQGRYTDIRNLGDGAVHLLLLAFYLATKPSGIIFMEEPETNVHPECQRHMMNVMRKSSLAQVFATTHSPVLLDSAVADVVYRIEHDSIQSCSTRCATNEDLYRVLDLLDVRASDLLQSNFVIWVEGLTDKMFIKACFQHLGFEAEEGVHFCFALYGGDNRKHFSFGNTPDSDRINVLGLSRHAAMVCDSDRAAASDTIGTEKIRLQEQCRQQARIFWMTEGRETENYLGNDLLNRTFNRLLERSDISMSLGQYDDIGVLIRDVCGDLPHGHKWKGNYDKNKVRIMSEILADMQKEDLEHLDLIANISALMDAIRQANGMKSGRCE